MNKRLSKWFLIAGAGFAAVNASHADIRLVPIPIDEIVPNTQPPQTNETFLLVPVEVGALIANITLADANLDACLKSTATTKGWTYAGDVTELLCANDGITNLTGIEQFTHLLTLDLSGNALTDITPLASLTQLNVLDVSGTGQSLTSADIAKLKNLSSLTTLTVTNDASNPLTGSAFAGGFTGLTSLTIITSSALDDSLTGTLDSRYGDDLDLTVDMVAGTTAIGFTPGQFNVGPSGAASYNIPIAIPPGTAGMQPQLSLAYNSQGGNGLMGVGWSLQGLSAITRCPKTYATEGTAGGVDLTANDRFCLDGQKLVLTSGTYGGDGAQYRTEIDGFTRITSYGTAGTGPAYFIAETKSGQTIEYGNTANSRIEASGSSEALVWAANKISDTVGNYISVTYTETTGTASGITGVEFFPTQIDYTGNSTVAPYAKVTFVYDTARSDKTFSYVGGTAVASTRRLAKVRAYDQGSLVREYRLTYQNQTGTATGRLRLATVTECNSTASTATCLSPTTFGWQEGSSGFLDELTASTSNSGYNSAQIIDIDGDGRQELVTCSSASSTWQVIQTIPYPMGEMGASFYTSAPCTGGYTYARPFDYDHDGRMDLLVPHTASGDAYWYVLPSTGNGFGTPINTNVPNSGYNKNPQVMDVNGDGRQDLVTFYMHAGASTDTWHINLGDDSVDGLSPGTIDTLLIDTLYSYVKVIDYNGDGMMDLLIPHTPVYSNGELLLNGYWYVRLSTGDGFSTNINSQITYLGYDKNPQIMDVNGDGRQDLVTYYTTAGASSATWHINLSAGNGLAVGAKDTLLTDSRYAEARVIDYNGDGMMDLLIPHTASGDAYWYVLKSTGSNLLAGVNTNIPNSGYSNNPQVLDLNGDGLQDFLLAIGSYWNARLHVGVAPDLLTSIDNGAGSAIAITFDKLTDDASGNVYTKGTGVTPAFPQQDFQGPVYVVSNYTTSDGLGGNYPTSYTYQGARINLQGRGFSGFDKITATDTRTGIVTATTYADASTDDNWPLSGMARSVVKTLNGVTLSRVDNTLDYVSSGAAGNKRYFPFVATSVEKAYDYDSASSTSTLVTKTTTTTFYNGTTFYNTFNGAPPTECPTAADSNYGNVTCVVVSTVGGGQTFTKTTLNTYKTPDTVNWILGRLQNAKVTSTTPADTIGQTRESSFTYDDVTGLLLTETIEPNGNASPNLSVKQTTTYTYDPFGNKASTTVSGADGINRATYTDYYVNPQPATAIPGRFLYATTVSPAIGVTHTEYREYNARYGTVSKLTGPNNLVTQWSYDSFGRQTLETRADGTTTETLYHACSSGDITSGLCPANAKYYTMTAATGAPTGYVFYDLLDRPLREATVAADGYWRQKDTIYNNLGQVAKASQPYASNTTTPYWIYYGYDDVGRVTSDSLPTTAATAGTLLTETDYNGLTTTVTAHRVDPDGTTTNLATTQTKDALGQLTKVTDADGMITKYTYDPFGNLKTVTDPANNVVTMTYDIRGRKIDMIDPDMGHWTYTYWSTGELHTQTDANGDSVTMIYDNLGRMKTRDESEGTTTWTYDTAANGKGKLASVAWPGGDSRSYTYDSLGRPKDETTTVGGTAYTLTTAYDSASRVDTITYPQGFKVQNAYGTQGYLSEVRDPANPATKYWSDPIYNGIGQVAAFTLGNGLMTVNQYDEATGRLVGISTGLDALDSSIQYLDYTTNDRVTPNYDSLGNLKRRRDFNANRGESFTYDNLNRLTTATVTNVGSISVAYNSLGNITSKSDVGSYTYDTVHKHAVKTAGGGTVYTYDLNGNQLIGPNGRSIVYTSFNQPSSLTANGKTLAFGYDGDHARLTQSGPDGMTVYVHPRIDLGAHYEKETKADGTVEHKNYIYAGQEVIAIRTTRSTGVNDTRYLHKDHLGSVDTITNESGAIVQKLAYDAWGKRRNSNWSAATGTITSDITHHGFTGHEMLDDVGLIHMNARIYDPTLGRFLQADPTVQAPGNPQTLNRYSYTQNNPLSYTDPNGYWSFKKDFMDDVLGLDGHHPLANALVTITVGLVLGPAGLGMNSFTAGFAAGFVGSGGDFKTGVIMGITAGVYTGIGDLAAKGTISFEQAVVAHAMVGGVSSVLQGGKFGPGAMSAGFTHSFSSLIGPPGTTPGEVLENTVQAAVIGGTASVIGGGKFANGAVTGAFSRLFNDEQIHQTVKKLLLNETQSANIFRISGYRDVDSVIISTDAQQVATDMYFAAVDADEGMSWIQRTFEAVAGGWKTAPLGIMRSLTVSTVTDKTAAYFRVGEYGSVEARYAGTGAGIINTTAWKYETPYNELERK